MQAIAQNGLAFTQDPFDRERYQQLQQLVTQVLHTQLERATGHARPGFWEGEHGYATPKVDVRGAVFTMTGVLLVRERSDGGWTLPGGWVDVNDSPAAAVAREILRGVRLPARAVKLAALVDKNRHPHPPGIHHIYKLLFLCELTGGSAGAEPGDRCGGVFPGRRVARRCPRGASSPARSSACTSTTSTPGLPTDFD